MASAQSPPEAPRHILILGAGVTALQTALSLLQSSSPIYEVTLIAAHHPGDLDIEYTSPWAGGFWRSHVGPGDNPKDAEIRAWDGETLEAWLGLLGAEGYFQDGFLGPGYEYVTAGEEGGTGAMVDEGKRRREEAEKKIGLGLRTNVIVWSTETGETARDGSGIWWKDIVWNFSVLNADELGVVDAAVNAGNTFLDQGRAGVEGRVDAGKVELLFGVKYDTICINIPQYLLYLHEQVSRRGGKFIKRHIPTSRGVEGVLREMKSIFSSCISSTTPLHGIVLAAGLASRHFLAPSEASNLFPIRGQTVLVRGETHNAQTHIFSGIDGKASEEELTYIVPRPGSGCTIIGGCKQVGSYSASEDEELTTRILGRARGLVPDLLNESGEFDVLSVQVGWRPGSKGGPRVEKEVIVVEGEDTMVVWAYGHAGAGYQNSVGSASKVMRLFK